MLVVVVETVRGYLVRWLPVIIWMVLIFTLSAQSQRYLAPEPYLDFSIKKVGHLGLYFVLALLLHRALSMGEDNWARRRRYVLAILIATLYAVSDEVHQAFVPGRGPGVIDVAIDVAGAGFGLALRALKTRLD